MRPGAKNQLRRDLIESRDRLTQAIDELDASKPEPLTSVGSGWWVDNGVSVNIGDTYHLSVTEARKLVAQLVAAIYCCERGGNTEHPEAQDKEMAFLEALKTHLFFAMTDEQIEHALRDFSPSPKPPGKEMFEK